MSLRAGGTAPRWVIVLGGVMIGFTLIAVESHGPGRIIAGIVMIACLLPLLARRVGARQHDPDDRAS